MLWSLNGLPDHTSEKRNTDSTSEHIPIYKNFLFHKPVFSQSISSVLQKLFQSISIINDNDSFGFAFTFLWELAKLPNVEIGLI